MGGCCTEQAGEACRLHRSGLLPTTSIPLRVHPRPLPTPPPPLRRADPFDPDSPIKQMGIQTFPPDMFFVLRVVQVRACVCCGLLVGRKGARV